MARSQTKKLTVVESFAYAGPDDDWDSKKTVIIGPGEPIPKLNSAARERLLRSGRIQEVDLYGELIPNVRLTSMNAEQLNKLLEGKGEPAVVRIIEGTKFDKDTMSRILVFCEKQRYRQAALLADQKLSE